MELSRKRIDDAPELDVHSSRFVTSPSHELAPVHGRTSIIPWCRSGGTEMVSRAVPGCCPVTRPVEDDTVVLRQTCLLTRFSSRSCAKGYARCPETLTETKCERRLRRLIRKYRRHHRPIDSPLCLMAAVYRIRLNRTCAPDNSSQLFIKLDTSCDLGIIKRRS
jgi:hypothetical protein